jgi:hydroxymethylglutaryl-CoA reductase
MNECCLIARWSFGCRSITESGQFDDDIDEEVQINSPTEGNQSMPFDG